MPVFVSRARFSLVFKLIANKVFVYCRTATKNFLIEQCLFFSLVQMSDSCECYTWERSIYKKTFFVEVTESSPVSEAYRKKKKNLSEGTKFRSDLKNSLIVEPVWKSSSFNDYFCTKTTFKEATSHILAKTASIFRLYRRTNPRETVRIHLKVLFDRKLSLFFVVQPLQETSKLEICIMMWTTFKLTISVKAVTIWLLFRVLWEKELSQRFWTRNEVKCAIERLWRLGLYKKFKQCGTLYAEILNPFRGNFGQLGQKRAQF